MKEIIINLGERSYPVYIERKSITDRGIQSGNIITDTNVARKYKNLLDRDDVFIVQAGEGSKSHKTYIDLAKKLEDVDEITAIGGGVVGDLAGFIASTLKRGVRFTQIPTTLIAMVDASIGGKNGINVGKRKNYLGTIYQPKMVLIDPCFLETLPKKEIPNGIAEIIKYGAIQDFELLKRMQARLSIEDGDLEEIVVRCVNIKKYFVEQDEKDENIRHALNFGHTIGHALELGYNLSHGQAISIGMIKEAELGKRLGMIKDEDINILRTALKANGLPTEIPKGANIKEIIQLMKADKKGPLTFAFDKEHYAVQVNERDIIEVLKQ